MQKVNEPLLKVSALTLDGQARQELGRFGNVNFAVNWSYLLERKSQQFDGAAEIDELKRADFYPGARSKLTSYLTWSKGIADVTLGFDRTGETPDFQATYSGEGGKFGAWTVWTLTTGIQATPNIRLTATANNLFDTKPPRDNTIFGFFNNPYARVADVFGRQFLIQANVSF